MLSSNVFDKLGEAYQAKSEEIGQQISAEFPEFSRMDVVYIRDFIQENRIPLEIAIKNLKDAPMGYLNRIKYGHKLNSCYYVHDQDLAIVARLLNEFDNFHVMEFIKESLDNHKALWKVIADKSGDFNKDTAEYLSAEYE